MIYRGIVTNMLDPEGKGRVRLRIPAVLGPAESGWATPALEAAGLAVGDRVFVFFTDEDNTAPAFIPEGQLGRGLNFHGVLDSSEDLPEDAVEGDAYFIQGNLWVYNGTWANVGPITGGSEAVHFGDAPPDNVGLLWVDTTEDVPTMPTASSVEFDATGMAVITSGFVQGALEDLDTAHDRYLLKSGGTLTGDLERAAVDQDDSLILVRSRMHAGLELYGDIDNATGEPGGAYVHLRQDGGLVDGVLSIIQSSGEDGRRGGSYSGTTNNSLLFGHYGANNVHLGTDGVVRLTVGTGRVTTTVPISSPSGSQSVPAFAFDNNSDSGMYATSTGDVYFSRGGSWQIGVRNGNVRFGSGVSISPDGGTLQIDGEVLADSGNYRDHFRMTRSDQSGEFTLSTATAHAVTGNTIRALAGGTHVATFGDGGIGSNARFFAGNNGSGGAPSYSFSSNTNSGMYNVSGELRFSATGSVGLRLRTNGDVEINNDMHFPGGSKEIHFTNRLGFYSLASDHNPIFDVRSDIGGSDYDSIRSLGVAANTTGSAANVHITGAANFNRSTSSARFKKDVEDLDPAHYRKALELHPVWYRSNEKTVDRQDWSWYGLIAEEVAEIDPRLVAWGHRDGPLAYAAYEDRGEVPPDDELVPEGVQYDRVAIWALALLQEHEARIAELELKEA